MKTMIGILLAMAVAAASGVGCVSSQDSPQGGVTPKDQEFSISVPTSDTLKQGVGKEFTVSLNRGADFKQDVMLNVKSEGISVIPDNVMVRASDKPDVKFQLVVAKFAALGDYRVSVKGTPETGDSTSMEFIVTVVDQ